MDAVSSVGFAGFWWGDTLGRDGDGEGPRYVASAGEERLFLLYLVECLGIRWWALVFGRCIAKFHTRCSACKRVSSVYHVEVIGVALHGWAGKQALQRDISICGRLKFAPLRSVMSTFQLMGCVAPLCTSAGGQIAASVRCRNDGF